MRRAFVIVNPAAGGGRTRRLWPRIRDQFRQVGIDFRFVETTGPGIATAMARTAANDGWPLIVAVGGDGTVNEVVNGLVEANGRALASLGAILTGRGRDVCRSFGVSAAPDDAVRRLVEGTEIVVDLGVADWGIDQRRYFVNAAGAGFDAVVARRAQSFGGSGTVPYVKALLGSLWEHRPVPGRVHVDGALTWSGAMTTAVVANGPYYGGGMKIAPLADPEDGLLDVIVVGDFRRGELLRWLPTVYRGAHLASRKVRTYRGRTVHIDTDRPVPVHLDGEATAETPVSVRIRPRVLRLRR